MAAFVPASQFSDLDGWADEADRVSRCGRRQPLLWAPSTAAPLPGPRAAVEPRSARRLLLISQPSILGSNPSLPAPPATLQILVEERGVNLAAYPFRVYLAPPGLCRFVGLAYLGCNFAAGCRAWLGGAAWAEAEPLTAAPLAHQAVVHEVQGAGGPLAATGGAC